MYTREELEAMTTEQLQDAAKLLGVEKPALRKILHTDEGALRPLWSPDDMERYFRRLLIQNILDDKRHLYSRADRPVLADYFMSITHTVAQRSTCLRRKVGAIAVKDKRILATGYNGAPSGMEDCLEIGSCLRIEKNIPSGQRHELCRAVHAEQNVIIQAAKHGISLDGALLYCTTFPCNICAKMLINTGIKYVFYSEPYVDEEAARVFSEAKVATVHLNSKGLV